MIWEQNGTETLRVPTFSLVLTSRINRQKDRASSLRAIIDITQNDKTIGLNRDKTATSTL